MATSQSNEGLLTPRQEERWFRRGSAALLAFFIAAGVVLFWSQRQAKLEDRRESALLLNADANDPGVTATVPADTSQAMPVVVGIYLERVADMSIKGATWKPIFDIWFRWQGDIASPAENLVIMEGDIDTREKLAELHEGDQHYERYRIAATITKPFSITLFPLDEQLLLVGLENGAMTRNRLLFVPDLDNSSVSSRVSVQGYAWSDWHLLEKAHSYKTSRGDPRLDSGSKSTFSQIRFGLPITRTGWGLYLKMVIALYVSVAIALLACFIKPINVDPRFGLGVGALFAAVANSYVVGTYVPDTGELALADVLNILGILTILVTLIESTVSLYLYERYGEKTLSARLDRMSFKVILGGFVVANLAAVLAARL
jgi:hypothetical protein